MIVIESPRLQLSQFQMTDAPEVFGCITPAIAKFMPWEPPSWSEYVTGCEKRLQAPQPNKFSFVIRRLDNRECLGMASLEDADSLGTSVDCLDYLQCCKALLSLDGSEEYKQVLREFLTSPEERVRHWAKMLLSI